MITLDTIDNALNEIIIQGWIRKYCKEKGLELWDDIDREDFRKWLKENRDAD